MLKQKISYIKNIIFIKAILYLSAISFAGWLVSSTFNSLSNKNNFLNKFDLRIDNLSRKITVLKENPHEITKAHNEYLDLSDDAANFSCIIKMRLNDKLNNIDEKFNLSKPVEVKIHPYIIESKSYLENYAFLRSADIDLKISTFSFEDFLNITSYAFKYLNDNGTITQMNIVNNDVLNPLNINDYEQGKVPGLIYGNVKFKKSEIKLNDSI